MKTKKKNYFLIKLILKVIKIIYKFIFYFITRMNIQASKNRFIRSYILRNLNELIFISINGLNYRVPFYVQSKQNLIYYDLDGVLLSSNTPERFRKIANDQKTLNEAKYLYDFFFKNYQLENFIDIGANVGEYSIFFSKKYPKAKIACYEGSKNNFKFLDRNIIINNSKNITSFNNVVSNFNGICYIEENKGAGNKISLEKKIKNSNYGEAISVTLDDIFQKNNLNQIDLLKVDIEGSMGNLNADLIKNINKINNMFLEFAYEDLKKFIPLIQIANKKFDIYDVRFHGEISKISGDEIINIFSTNEDRNICLELFFKKKNA